MGKVIKGIVVGAALLVGGIVLGPGVIPLLLTTIGTNKILGGISSALGKKPPRQIVTVEYSGTVEPARLIYGKCRVSGMHTIPPLTTGTNNKYLHKVLTIAGHQCNAITAVYFDQVAIGTIGSITGASTDGLVSTGAYANKAWIRRYLGTSSQTADYILDTALTVWTSSHRGRGITYVAIQKEYDETVYKNGETQETFDVEGKICYDPRLDSSPGADPTNVSYAAFTANPALQLADYLTDQSVGVGETTARIDWDMVADAADICDETVACPTASTQTRYTSNLVLLATSAYEDNIEAIAKCMLGTCLYSGGKWRIRAGAWEAASFEITESLVMGPIAVETAYPYKERWNGVRGTFIDPNANYQSNEFPAVSDAAYVSDDGESVFKDIQLDGCSDVYEAQRSAILFTRKSRNKKLITVPCSMALWKVRPGDTGIITFAELGLSSATVRCESWKFTPEGLVVLTLREELSSDWDDPVEGDYLSPLNISNPTPVYFTPGAPSALASVAGKSSLTLTWTAPTLVPTGAKYEVYEYTSNTPFSSASKVWEGIATRCTLSKSDVTHRFYWVMLRMPDGTAGVEYPTSANGVEGYATLVVDAKVNSQPADGNQAYSAGTAPVVEVTGLSGHVTYTAPSGEDAQVLASWSCQARISNTTSGAAVGAAYIGVRVQVNSVDVWAKVLPLEGYITGDTFWGMFAGTQTFSVPAGQAIDVYLQTYRTFTTTGIFPAQTMYWRDAILDLLPTKG